MPQSLSNIPIHLIFSTKYREPLLTKGLQQELYPYITGILRNLDCNLFQIGGIEDHMHILFQLSRKFSVAHVVERVKTGSTNWINSNHKINSHFHWQSGYLSLGVGCDGVRGVIKYIQNQEAHHKKASFQEEVLQILDEYGLQYDERYLWD